MGVYLPIKDYSAMQGPAPDGFHVPLNTEWQSVYDIWTALGGGSSDGTNFGIALKLPFAGLRSGSSAGVYSQGTDGRYWASSPYPSDANSSYYFYFNSSNVNPQNRGYRAFGFSVRCFKNSPTVPTSSWTKLYGTSIEAGGIFWSSTDGLISLSSDGQTWITIADKNLGATTVWNSGDTLSETNCGKYYQWGNNYGFPRTGTIANQSTTQVDASNYGPGNYYSSDTFIKYNGRWDTTDNGNLWGGVTGVNPMSELKNAYIGEYVPIVQTYTIPATSGTSSNVTIGISGKKIKKIIVEGTTNTVSGWGQALLGVISSTINSSYSGYFVMWAGAANVSYYSSSGYLELKYGSTTQGFNNVSTSYFPGAGNTISYKIIYTEDLITSTYQGYTSSFTPTGDSATTIETLLNSSDLYINHSAIMTTISNATVTVTYI